MGEIRTLDKRGDLKVSWNADNEDETKTAREIFEKKTKEGYAAFKDRGIGTKGDRIKVFDKLAERIVLVPPITGG